MGRNKYFLMRLKSGALPFLALAMLLSLSFALDPISEQDKRTTIDVTSINISNQSDGSFTHVLTVRISFFNTSFYQQLHPENYEGLAQNQGNLYQPAPANKPYSDENYSSSVQPLPGAPLYFTYNGYNVTDSSGGSRPCNPAQPTDPSGTASCTIDYYLGESGAKSVEGDSSCGMVEVYFNGIPGQQGYQSSAGGAMLCPQNNTALSAFGTSLSTALLNNSGICFPVLLIISLFLASMYYSGRNPLSLFDLTTPRLPKMRQFRVKGGTAPQMIRSVARKYFQIQGKAESDTRKALSAMIASRGLGGREARKLKRDAGKEAALIFKELRALLRSKNGLSDEDIKNLNSRMQSLFKTYGPAELTGASAKYASAAASLLEMYNKAFQAMKIMGEARGTTGNIISRGLTVKWKGRDGKEVVHKIGTTSLMDVLTRARVNFENSTAVRFVGRIPILKSIVNVPTKAFDHFAQYRASRQGGMVMRREIMGGLLYTGMTTARDFDPRNRFLKPIAPGIRAVGNASYKGLQKTFDGKKAVGKFTTWLFNWNFAEFKKKHDLFARRFRELYDPLENQRLLTIYGHNKLYEELLAKLTYAAPTRENAIKHLDSLMKEMEGKSGAADLRKSIDVLKARIDSLKQGASVDGIEKEYSRIYKKVEALGGTGDKAISLGKWKHFEDELERITSARYGSQAKRLEELADIVKPQRAKEAGVTQEVLSLFKKHEQEVVRQLLLARMENDLYVAIDGRDIRAAKNSGDKKMLEKFGTDEKGKQYSDMTKAEFDAKMQVMRSAMLKDAAKDGVFGRTWGSTLLEIRKAINDNLDQKFAGRTDLSAMLRYNMAAENAAGFFITRKLQQLGIADKKTGEVPAADGRKLKVGRLDDFDYLFGAERDARTGRLKREGAGAMLAQLADAMTKEARKHNRNALITPEEAYRRMLADTVGFLSSYNVQAAKTAHAFFGSAKERGDALKDITCSDYTSKVLDWATANPQLEMAAQRTKFGFAGYDQKAETLLSNARALETMVGFISWGKQQGGSWGSSTMGLFSSLRDYNQINLETLRAFYANLCDKDGRYRVDPQKDRYVGEGQQKKSFTELLSGAGGFNAESYSLLMQRGYTFADVKNGLGFMLRGDGRGGMVLLEYDKNVLALQGKGLVVNKKDDLRDLSPLFARLSESSYIDLPTNMRILVKHGEGDKAAWLDGNPFKDNRAANAWQAAYSDKTVGKSVSDRLAGITRDAKGNITSIDKNAQMLKVVSSADLGRMRDNPGNFFGNLSGFNKNWAGLVHGKDVMTGKLSEAFYSSLDHRSTKMRDWVAAQFQIRQAIDSYAHLLEDNYATVGKKRYDVIDREKHTVKSEVLKELKSTEMMDRDDGTISKEVYADRLAKMETLEKHDTSIQFRRNVASKTAKEIADAESKVYAAGLELKAIGQQYKEGRISASDYSSQKTVVERQLNVFKAEEKQARKDYGALSDIIVGWSGSHTNVPYGSTRSLYTSFTPLAKHFDSKYVDGMRYDFYWAAESGVMRDPRAAIGAGFGMDYSFYVGYQTGQTTYERARFYMTNAMWEQQKRYSMNLTQFVHKWFNPMVSQMARDASHYPSYMEMHPLYPGESASKKFVLFPVLGAPFRRHMSSDFVRTRAQQAVDFFGANYINAYQAAHDKGFVSNTLDKFFTDSGHYSTDARMVWNQRNLDQFAKLDRTIFDEKSPDYKKAAHDAYERFYYSDAGSEEARNALRELAKYADIRDRRPLGVQRGVSGSDMDEDGSRNRFMNLYVGFHENIWKPTVPGMMDNDPITGNWRPFPQIAAHVDRAEEGTRLDNLRSLTTATAEKDESGKWNVNYGDAFNTHSDANREAYKRDSTALLHLMKYQREMLAYSPLNGPSLLYFNPIYGAAILGSRHLLANTRFGATSSVGVEQYGGQHDYSGMLKSVTAKLPFGIGSYSRQRWAERGNVMLENLYSDYYISKLFERESRFQKWWEKRGHKKHVGTESNMEAYAELMRSLGRS